MSLESDPIVLTRDSLDLAAGAVVPLPLHPDENAGSGAAMGAAETDDGLHIAHSTGDETSRDPRNSAVDVPPAAVSTSGTAPDWVAPDSVAPDSAADPGLPADPALHVESTVLVESEPGAGQAGPPDEPQPQSISLQLDALDCFGCAVSWAAGDVVVAAWELRVNSMLVHTLDSLATTVSLLPSYVCLLFVFFFSLHLSVCLSIRLSLYL